MGLWKKILSYFEDDKDQYLYVELYDDGRIKKVVNGTKFFLEHDAIGGVLAVRLRESAPPKVVKG